MRLQAFAAPRPFIREVRGLGLLWALELGEPGGPGPGHRRRAWPACATSCRARRLHLHKRDNLVFLAPPLVTSEAELEEGLVALGAALDESFA